MNRFVLPVLLAAAALARGATPELGQLDASPTLFTVMAAINAAGYDADLASPNNHPLRNAIRAELAKRNIPCLPALKEFYEKHRNRSATFDLSQYISFALSSSGPPNFTFKTRDLDVPPDASVLSGLVPLLARFYKEANIPDLWQRSQPAINQYLERYHQPIADAVFQVNTYLRQQTSGFSGSRFQVLVELLAAPNQVQTRSYGTEYTVVVTPSPDLRTFDIRHAYLHYILEPMATRNEEILSRKRALLDQAQRAPALNDVYKQDFLRLTTESLIKAVEARLDHHPEGVQEALLQGYILTPYFSEELVRFEKQEQSMLVFYKDMVQSIEIVKENQRLSAVDFTGKVPVKMAPVQQPPPPPRPSGPDEILQEAEQHYLNRNLDEAKKLYLQVLQETNDNPRHATAYYGLARIAALDNDPETSEKLFQKTLTLEPEPPVKAWCLVYLGKLALARQDPTQAKQYFQQVLTVNGASLQAREEAARSMQAIK